MAVALKHALSGLIRVPLADACVTEWRYDTEDILVERKVPLADACVTEWRKPRKEKEPPVKLCHSLMLVLLNGGPSWRCSSATAAAVPLADACVTEWRHEGDKIRIARNKCHSLMLVLLNGGARDHSSTQARVSATR